MTNQPSVTGTPYQYCKGTIALRNTLEQGFVELGERLHKIYENQLYANSWDTWKEFLEELKIDPAVASKLMKIYRTLVLEYGVSKTVIAKIGRDSAYEITGVANTKEQAEKWLDKATVLRRDDIRIAIKEAKTGVPQSECEHESITIKYCPKCGLRERIV